LRTIWAKDLAVNIGTSNLGELRLVYFRDSSVAFEAFKAGYSDWRVENAAKNWATGYDFPSVSDGRVVLEEFPIRSIWLTDMAATKLRSNVCLALRWQTANCWASAPAPSAGSWPLPHAHGSTALPTVSSRPNASIRFWTRQPSADFTKLPPDGLPYRASYRRALATIAAVPT
jgi:hypothetical protein